jgi:histidyl-tRNA synthetase
MSFPLCFRYERPQRGRVREFRQFNLDILGDTGLLGDLEAVLVLDRIMRNLGARPGTYEIRYSGRAFTGAVLQRLGIPEDACQKAMAAVDRIGKMPRPDWLSFASQTLGNPELAALLEKFASVRALDDPWLSGIAGGLDEYARLEEFSGLVRDAGLASAVFDASIVRGLDYYTGTVFELTDTGGENRRAVCGGGRYDNLVGLFGGKPTSGVGFGLGILTLGLFLETYGLLPEDPAASSRPDVFVAVYSRAEYPAALVWAESMRSAGLRVVMEIEGRNLNRQFRSAGKMGARFVVTAGPEEVASGSASVRDMVSGEQRSIPGSGLASAVRASLVSG